MAEAHQAHQAYAILISIFVLSIISLIGTMVICHILRNLFSFMSWMYEHRVVLLFSSITGWCLRTFYFQDLIKLLKSKHDRLYGYQNSLPKLPVTPVKNTMEGVSRLSHVFHNSHVTSYYTIL